MARRIEVELTSNRDDGTWTWRAAGAKKPKGILEATLLYPDAKVGDVVRADAEFGIDGIDVINVLAPKGDRKEKPTLEILGSGKEEQLVTTQLAPKGKGGRGRGRDRDGDGDGRRDNRRGRRDGGGGGGRRDGGRNERGGGGRDERRGGGGRGREESGPKPKKLRPGKAHRLAWLEALPEEQKPIGEQLNRGGGLPQIRQALEAQSDQAVKDGQPAINPAPLLAVAENMLPGYRAAEWRDRAEAALADIEELDLRDLRSVVGSAESGARDDESRAMATQLRDALTRRVEADHSGWLAELGQVLGEGRTVRALRLSSRPPKAGAPLPADISSRLIASANEALTSDTAQDRWATVLNAIAFSPVRQQVTPAGLPAEPNEALIAEVTKLSTRTPEIAKMFGIEPTEMPRKRRPRKSKGGKGGGEKAGGAPKAEDTPKAEDAPKPEAGATPPAEPKPEEASTAPATPDSATEPATTAPEASPAGGEAEAAPVESASAEAESAAAPAAEAAPAEPASVEAATAEAVPVEEAAPAEPAASEAPAAPEAPEAPATPPAGEEAPDA